MNNFEFKANVPIPEGVLRELAITNPLWNAYKARQNFPGSPHKQTRCIPLRGSSSFLKSYDPKAQRKATQFSYLVPETVKLVNSVLAKINVATVGNVLAVALAPEANVSPHIDEGSYPEHFERFHIVVTSPENNFFIVNGEVAFPQQGDVFFFNHRVMHSVGNPSPEWRVHLIVDVTLKE